MTDIFLAPGVRTPFLKAGGKFASHSALSLSAPIAKAMAAMARPDFIIWGEVIPDPTVSNIARELAFAAGLDPKIPAFSTVLACSTSFIAMVEAAGMIGKGGAHLAMVGGAETMSHVPIALKRERADAIVALFAKDPAGAAKALSETGAEDFDISRHGWVNRQTGRSQGDHTEDTVRYFNISREDQDMRALLSHQRAVAGQDGGFFSDLVLPIDGIGQDQFPRRDTSLEKLSTLPPAFDRASGTLTAGNSSPNTDGAASLWVGDADGMKRLGLAPSVRLIDWELAAIDFRTEEEGMLMAPARAIPRLLARHKLGFSAIDLWEIHEAFAAQVIANIKAASDPEYRRRKAGADFDLGEFPWERVNPNGGSLALGHPFAATGARILSQAAKELTAMKSGAKAIVSICADGGQGTVALLERI